MAAVDAGRQRRQSSSSSQPQPQEQVYFVNRQPGGYASSESNDFDSAKELLFDIMKENKRPWTSIHDSGRRKVIFFVKEWRGFQNINYHDGKNYEPQVTFPTQGTTTSHY